MSDELAMIPYQADGAALTTEQIDRLEEVKLAPPQILRKREVGGGRRVSYAPHVWFRDALDYVFGRLNWQWESVAHETLDGLSRPSISVSGRLTIFTPNGPRVFMGYGGSVDKKNPAIHIGDIQNSADTDAFKRACQVLGIGRDHMKSEEDVIEKAKYQMQEEDNPVEALMSVGTRLKGEDGKLLTRQQVEEKFQANVGKSIKEASAEEIKKIVGQMTQVYYKQKAKE